VNVRGAGKPRRWHSAIAIVAGLSLFAAVFGCWVVQAGLAAAAQPQPPASSQGVPDVGIDIGQVHSDHGSSPTNQKKPFKSAGIKRDRPHSRSRLARPLVCSPWLVALTALGFQSDEAHSAVPAAALANRDILTRLCVARR
jgi:hypothetical protein